MIVTTIPSGVVRRVSTVDAGGMSAYTGPMTWSMTGLPQAAALWVAADRAERREGYRKVSKRGRGNLWTKAMRPGTAKQRRRNATKRKQQTRKALKAALLLGVGGGVFGSCSSTAMAMAKR